MGKPQREDDLDYLHCYWERDNASLINLAKTLNTKRIPQTGGIKLSDLDDWDHIKEFLINMGYRIDRYLQSHMDQEEEHSAPISPWEVLDLPCLKDGIPEAIEAYISCRIRTLKSVLNEKKILSFNDSESRADALRILNASKDFKKVTDAHLKLHKIQFQREGRLGGPIWMEPSKDLAQYIQEKATQISLATGKRAVSGLHISQINPEAAPTHFSHSLTTDNAKFINNQIYNGDNFENLKAAIGNYSGEHIFLWAPGPRKTIIKTILRDSAFMTLVPSVI